MKLKKMVALIAGAVLCVGMLAGCGSSSSQTSSSAASESKSGKKVIGFAQVGAESGIELVKNGILQGTFTCKTGGKEAVEYAIKILNKEGDIPKRILLNSNKITKETLEH